MRLFALGCLATVVLTLRLSSWPSPWVIVVLILVLLASCVMCVRCRPAALGSVLAILMLSHSQLELHAAQLPDELIGEDMRVLVRVVSVPDRHQQRLSLRALILKCLSCGGQSLGAQRLQLSWYGTAPEIRGGQVWELTVRLKPMTGLRNPGGFDRVRWALAAGVHARGTVRQRPAARLVKPASRISLPALRQSLADQLLALPSANDRLGLVQALTLGIRHGVALNTWDLLRDTGTAHLLAISGLHISLLAGWAFAVGRLLASFSTRLSIITSISFLACDRRSVGLLLGLFAALSYALLAGFTLSTQRAVIMLAVWVLAGLRLRVLSASTALCVALAVVILHSPWAVLSAGFWLSFGTVACLFYLHQGHQRGVTGKLVSTDSNRSLIRHRLSQLGALGRTHVLLGMLLLPVSAWFFQSGSLVAPLANLFAVPWVGVVIVPLCFLALLASIPAPWLASVFLQWAQWAITVLLMMLQWLADVLIGSVTLVLPSATVSLLCLGGLLVLVSPRGLGVRWLCLPLLLPAVLFNLQRQALEGFETHVLDVGQGLAVLVFSDQHTLLFDTGGKVSADLSMFEAVVVPFLHSRGRRRIDTLVVSHTDEDHSFGVPDVVRRYPDVRLVSSVPLELVVSGGRDDARLPPVELCHAGRTWRDGWTVFSFLHPADGDAGSDNDRSCVLLIHHGASRVLLTGDIEAEGERRLAHRLRAAQQNTGDASLLPLYIDMMVAPHHGSRTSSTQVLLDTLRPTHIVFPAGNDNRYGFPHVDVQSRYELMGTVTYVTGMEGAVSFRFNRSGLDHLPSTWWQSHRRYWHGDL